MSPSTVYRLLSAILVTATPLVAQESVERVRLAEPDVTLAEPFSDVSGLRELSDGTVLVTDRLERALRRVDFASGVVEQRWPDIRGTPTRPTLRSTTTIPV